jgi:hypothetical protein
MALSLEQGHSNDYTPVAGKSILNPLEHAPDRCHKTVKMEPETPALNGRQMIDIFRLPGSRPCRHMGGHLTKGGRRMEVAHEVARPLNHPNAPLSEGKALAVVVQVVPGNPHWTRIGTDSRNPMG